MSILSDMPALLARNVALHGDAIAFIDDEREISYREFDGMVRNTVGWLQRQGIGEGDIVAVWLVNRIEWMALYFGLAHIGAAMMTVNTRYRSHEVEYILERSRAKMLILQLNFRKIDFPAVLRDVSHAAAASVERVAVVDGDGRLPAEILGKPTVAFDMQTPAPATAPAIRSPISNACAPSPTATTPRCSSP